jgi:hypothetical protein
MPLPASEMDSGVYEKTAGPDGIGSALAIGWKSPMHRGLAGLSRGWAS